MVVKRWCIPNKDHECHHENELSLVQHDSDGLLMEGAHKLGPAVADRRSRAAPTAHQMQEDYNHSCSTTRRKAAKA